MSVAGLRVVVIVNSIPFPFLNLYENVFDFISLSSLFLNEVCSF
jgi:hypothetical protein